MSRRHALVLIFCTVTLDALAVGVMMPVLPDIVLGFMGGDTALAAEVFGVLMTVRGLMQFFFSPVLGALSDRFGRRPMIQISSLALGLDYVVMALAPTLRLVFAGRTISGACASNTGTSYAYIADLTPPDGRAKAFGIIGIGFGLGYGLGPAIGGFLAGLDLHLPFWVAAAASLVNAALAWSVLPESLPPDRRMAFSWRRANPVGALRLLGSSRLLIGLAMVDFTISVTHHVMTAVFVLYTGYRYGWDHATVGATLAFLGVCWAIAQGLLIGPAVKWLGKRAALLVSLLIGCFGMTTYGLAPTGTWFWAGVPLMALWSIAGAVVQDLMTARVGADQQGQLQGANTSSRSIAGMVGPGVFAAIFARFLEQGPGAPFLAAGLLLAVAAAIGWLVTTPLQAADDRLP